MDKVHPEPPSFPWELVDGANGCSSPDSHEVLERLGWSRADDGEWLAHVSGWLCNPRERVFFHAEKSLLVPASLEHAAQVSAEAGVVETSQTAQGQMAEGGAGGHDPSSAEYELESAESDDDSDLMLDLEDDLEAATAQKKGSAEGKEDCEDRFVTRAGLPLGVVAGSSEGLCYFSAIYDGHAGSDCADYAATHLHKNLLSCYRQFYSTVQRKRQEELQRQGGKKRRQQQATQWLQQLNHSRDPLRPEERKLSVEMEALVRSCFSAFSITDKNYLGLSENSLTQDAGSTACAALFFGPDEQGALQLITAHAGDSRAVLCRNGEALRLTEDHKPNSPAEQKRIEAAGGQVASVQGVWRVLAADARGGRTVGLSTSRAIGDLALKKPKALVVSNPTVHVYTLHFEHDAFLVLASDGIFEVLSDQEVVKLILSSLPPTAQEAAQLVVDEAVKRGGADDKTCTVIYFKWRKDLFAPKVVTEPAESAEPAQHKRQSGGLQQEEQQGAASPSSRASDGEEAGERVQAAKTDCEAALQEKSKATAADSSSDSEQEKEPHAAASPADSREHEECPGRKEAVAIPEGAREVKEAGPSGSAEAARDEGSRPVRSSGLEEIAGITSSLDVETLIRKRKREQQLEEEAAAAAAAEAADDDFDIFGAAPAPDSPASGGAEDDNESD